MVDQQPPELLAALCLQEQERQGQRKERKRQRKGGGQERQRNLDWVAWRQADKARREAENAAYAAEQAQAEKDKEEADRESRDKAEADRAEAERLEEEERMRPVKEPSDDESHDVIHDKEPTGEDALRQELKEKEDLIEILRNEDSG